ncbi:MAG: thiamine-phosphate kinase [Bacillota bacterium]|nr:thiamine-phosphate kinase [Bacillota bacterium]
MSPARPDGPTRLGDLGERAWIARATAIWGRAGVLGGPEVVVGSGPDDAAVVRPPRGELVLTCDLMIEGVHFTRGTLGGYDLGWKALASNLSDVAAMGAAPLYALVSLAAPPSTEIAFLEEAWRGMAELAREAGVRLVGGDTSTSPGGIFLDMCVVGSVPPGGAWRAALARPGQLLCVTGDLGGSAAGLALLQGRDRQEAGPGAQAPQLAQPEPAAAPAVPAAASATPTPPALRDPDQEAVLARHRRPRPRLAEAAALGPFGARACRDVSDGLAASAHLIAEAAGVGVEIEAEAVPVAEATRAVARRLGRDPLDWALFGGEDYELALAAAPEEVGALRAALEPLGTELTVVGRFLAEEGVWLRRAGGGRQPLGRGYEHFGGGAEP